MATYTEHYNLKKPQPSEYYAIADFNGNADVIDDELFKKVDKVSGKGLSANDYTNADKSIVDGVTSALAGKVDKATGKVLSSNDYTNADKGIVDGVTSALAGKVDTSSVGSANGVAELDANGRVPSSQLPSYVDDVLEYVDLAHFPATGETGKIYIAEDTNKTYRWSGSDYAEISESLALGETSSTAYAGNKGKANADAIAAIKDGTNIDSFGDVETALAGKANSSDLGDKSNLTTTDKSSVVAAINEVNGGVIASVTADGVKTYSALFDELYALLSSATILYPERLKLSVGGITILYVTTPFIKYGCCYSQANGNVSHSVIFLKARDSMWKQSNISSTGAVTYDNLDAVVATNNQVISVIY